MVKFHYDSSSCSWEKGHIRKCTLKFWQRSLKVIGEIWKSVQSLPFDRQSMFTMFQIFSSGDRLTIKSLIWTWNTHIPPKKKLRHNISSLKNQPVTFVLNVHQSVYSRTMIAICCIACILSKQDDFANQNSMLKSVIQEAGHECIFLPKFHCKLNSIKMVSPIFPH